MYFNFEPSNTEQESLHSAVKWVAHPYIPVICYNQKQLNDSWTKTVSNIDASVLETHTWIKKILLS